jgi:hypothetical protein
MRKSSRSEPVLAEQVTLPTPAQHIFCWHTKIFYQNLAMIMTTRHCFNIANNVETLARYVDDET